MNKVTFTVIFCLACASCTEENINSELEGTWASDCFANFKVLVPSQGIVDTSTQIQHTFHGNSIESKSLFFIDPNCSQLDKSVNLIIAPNSPPINFTIGQQIILSDGLEATEIIFNLENGTINNDIYRIQNSTLYFGADSLSCFSPPATIEEALACNNKQKPTTINYSLGFTRK